MVDRAVAAVQPPHAAERSSWTRDIAGPVIPGLWRGRSSELGLRLSIHRTCEWIQVESFHSTVCEVVHSGDALDFGNAVRGDLEKQFNAGAWKQQRLSGRVGYINPFPVLGWPQTASLPYRKVR